MTVKSVQGPALSLPLLGPCVRDDGRALALFSRSADLDQYFQPSFPLLYQKRGLRQRETTRPAHTPDFPNAQFIYILFL